MSLGTVSELWRYPVKSMAGQQISECVVQEIFGIPGDRGRAIWDVEAGEIRSAKKIPALLQCVARYREEPSGHSISPVEITLPDSQEIESEDPGISAALSKALGREVRLCVRRPPEDLAHYRRAEKITDMGSEIREQCGLLPAEPLPEMGDIPPELLEFVSPPGTYFDGFPLHLITTASIRELARLAPASRIDVRRFRPNLVVETGASTREFLEFDWCGRELSIGGMRARAEMPMMRCSMVVWAQSDLPKDPSIMRTLVREAQQNLGIGLVVTQPGPVALGDPVEFVTD